MHTAFLPRHLANSSLEPTIKSQGASLDRLWTDRVWTDRLWTACHALMVIAIVSAVAAQARASVIDAAASDRDVITTIVNFFSFFTIWSNVIAAAVLAWAVIAGISHRRRRVESRALSLALICASTYMIVTGIVYNALLRGVELPQGTTVPWSNEVLHLVTPIFMVIVVVTARYRGPRLRWRDLAVVVSVPLVWILYTLIRGPLVTNPRTGERWWYPYPFLDPHVVAGGWIGVGIYTLAIAVTITGVGWCLVRFANARARTASKPSSGSDRLS